VSSIASRFEPLQQAFSPGGSDAAQTAACAQAAGRLRSDGNADLATSVESDVRGACYQYASTLSKQGNTYLWAARGAGGLAVAAGAVAAWLWVSGEDPDRYEAFRGESGGEGGASPEAPARPEGPKASLAPLPGGAMATLSLRF
jgi:hypothetical protein